MALGRTLRLAGRPDEAHAALREAVQIIRQTAGEASQEMAAARQELREAGPLGAARGGGDFPVEP
jgi:hypothetical protein